MTEVAPTRQAAQKILALLDEVQRPINYRNDIKPLFENTELWNYRGYAVWLLVNEGQLTRIGRGTYAGRLATRVRERSGELYVICKQILEDPETQLSDDLRFELGRLISRIERTRRGDSSVTVHA